MAAVLVLVGCRDEAPVPRVLRLVRVATEPSGVFLNEPLIFVFSDELDRISVTPHAVRVRGPGGRPARGSLTIEQRRIHFEPAPVRSATLDDGGFLPATAYEVEIRGFPHPDCVRGQDGAPLEQTWTWSFRTVDPENTPTGFSFQDNRPGERPWMRLHTQFLAPSDPIVFDGSEPIDPRTIDAEHFVLQRVRTDEQGRRIPGQAIDLYAVLSDNRPPDLSGRSRTFLHLWPTTRSLEGGEYQLHVDQYGASQPRDFGGDWFRVRDHRPTQPIRIEVQVGLEKQSNSHREEFRTPQSRSNVPAPGAGDLAIDGTARWSDTGRVEVRLPAAAGSGADGEVALGDVLAEADVHATTLRLAEGRTCLLDAGPGLVVLRAQGRLQIDGVLKRRVRGRALAYSREHDPEATGRPGSGTPLPDTLSSWLARAGAEGRDWSEPSAGEEPAPCGWTVLIAGGDLVVGGRIDIADGLLLVAGGRIWFTGQTPPGRWHYLGEGVDPSLGVDAGETHGLILDTVTTNPLARPLRLAVLSRPIPREGHVLRWRSAEVEGHHGAGSHRVRYVGERPGEDGGLWIEDQPALLGDSPFLRLLIELEVPARDPSTPWDPPYVDSVEVVWWGAPAEEER